jgi:DNA-binding winged helix-turn-helix (wHTH) protein
MLIQFGAFVSESALLRIELLRRAVGDSGSGQHTIATVNWKGYRFVATVRHADRSPTPSAGPTPEVIGEAMLGIDRAGPRW